MASVKLTRMVLPGLFFCMAIACNSNNNGSAPKQSAAVQDAVRQMAASIARDLSREGPIAWLRYFEQTPGFFMASEGQLVFPGNDSATSFIKNILVKNIHTIDLHWSDIRIDSLTPQLAGIAAIFHEDLTDFSGKKIPEDGYFTGIAEQTPGGWQLRNAHWSVIKK